MREYILIIISFFVVLYLLYKYDKALYGFGIISYSAITLFVKLKSDTGIDFQQLESLIQLNGVTMWEKRLFPSLLGITPAALIFLFWKLYLFLKKHYSTLINTLTLKK